MGTDMTTAAITLFKAHADITDFLSNAHNIHSWAAVEFASCDVLMIPDRLPNAAKMLMKC